MRLLCGVMTGTGMTALWIMRTPRASVEVSQSSGARTAGGAASVATLTMAAATTRLREVTLHGLAS